MPKFELLNYQMHRHLRMQPVAGATPHFVQIVTSEFSAAALASPVMLSKDPQTGDFFVGAVMSLKPGEAPLKSVDERGGLNPLSRQCSGFYISGEQIAIDRDNPRFSEVDGELLFDDAQQPNECLRQMQIALGKYHGGLEATRSFIDSMNKLKLIEPVDMSLSFDSGEKLTIKGLYTIGLDSLRDIDDAAALRLFRSGYLQLAYTIATSLPQVGILAHLRNRQLVSNPQS